VCLFKAKEQKLLWLKIRCEKVGCRFFKVHRENKKKAKAGFDIC
jgi:hypothetical protein